MAFSSASGSAGRSRSLKLQDRDGSDPREFYTNKGYVHLVERLFYDGSTTASAWRHRRVLIPS